MTPSSPATTVLLPCPFCGGTDLDTRGDNAIFCNQVGCEAGIDMGHTVGPEARQDVTRRWNTRAAPSRVSAGSANARREKVYAILYEQLDLSTEVIIELAECGNLGDVTDAILSLDPAQQAWQPIETAPKDALILVATKHKLRPHRIAYWSERQFSDFGNGWAFDGNGFITPTHWQPLPTPPLSSTHGKASTTAGTVDIAEAALTIAIPPPRGNTEVGG